MLDYEQMITVYTQKGLSKMAKEYPLARLKTTSWASFRLVEFGDTLSYKDLQRDATFRREVEHGNIDKVELFMFENPANAYMTYFEDDPGSEENKWRVYIPSEDTRIYEECGNFTEFKKNWKNLPIGEENKKRVVRLKLTGKSEDENTWDEEFKDMTRVSLIAENNGVRLEMHHHQEFIRPVYLMYVPVINEKNDVEWHEISHEDVIFSNAHQPKRDSFLSVNKEAALILINDYKHDIDRGKTYFYDNEGNELFTVDSKDNLTDKHLATIKKHAIPKSDLVTIPIGDMNTRVTMVWN